MSDDQSARDDQPAALDLIKFGDISAAVGAHPFLQPFSTEQLDELANCAQVRDFQPGQLIFKQGDSAAKFYLIISGAVSLSHAGLTGNLPVQYLGSGDALGWSWLFPPFAWHFNAMTLEPSRILEFDGERIHELCDQRPEFGYLFMSRIAHVVINRLQNTRQKLFRLTGGGTPHRTQ